MTAHDDAVKAAAEALHRASHHHSAPSCTAGVWYRDKRLAEAAVAAAAPILLAAERARIAVACRAERDRVKALADAAPYLTESVRALVLKADAWEEAARIAETAPEEPTDA